MIERMTSTKDACETLGVSASYMAQVKRELGLTHAKKFFLSDVERHIRQRLARHRRGHQAAVVGNSDARSLRRARGNA